jgi:hypothetical protein
LTRAVILLNSEEARRRASVWCRKLPEGSRVTFHPPKRTLAQNDRLWAMLTDFATQLDWHGLKLTPNDWKLLFLDKLRHEMRLVPNLDGTGFINLGRSSSDLSKEEMSNMIELMFAFGTNHGVVFHD